MRRGPDQASSLGTRPALLPRQQTFRKHPETASPVSPLPLRRRQRRRQAPVNHLRPKHQIGKCRGVRANRDWGAQILRLPAGGLPVSTATIELPAWTRAGNRPGTLRRPFLVAGTDELRKSSGRGEGANRAGCLAGRKFNELRMLVLVFVPCLLAQRPRRNPVTANRCGGDHGRRRNVQANDDGAGRGQPPAGNEYFAVVGVAVDIDRSSCVVEIDFAKQRRRAPADTSHQENALSRRFSNPVPGESLDRGIVEQHGVDVFQQANRFPNLLRPHRRQLL